MTPVPLTDTNGEFWLDGIPPMRGKYVPANGEDSAEVTLAGILPDGQSESVTEINGQTRISFGSVDQQVASFAPRDVFGTLDSGDKISLLEANNYGGDGLLVYPRFVPKAVILGARVGAGQRYTAVRFQLDRPAWIDSLTAGECAEVGNSEGTVQLEENDIGRWIVYACVAQPMSLFDGGARDVILGCTTAIWMITDRTCVPTRLEVRTAPDGPWLRVEAEEFSRPNSDISSKLLMSFTEVTIERLAAGIDLHRRLHGLDAAIKDLDDGAVPVQVWLGATLIEAYHRRLVDFEQSQYPESSPGARKAVRLASQDAARMKAADFDCWDPADVGASVGAALSHFADVSYRQRVNDVLTEVADCAPQLIASVPALPSQIVRGRNDVAHYLIQKDEPDTYYRRWAVLTIVIPWLLRAFLLGRLGVDSARINAAFSSATKYQFACANARHLLGELGPRASD